LLLQLVFQVQDRYTPTVGEIRRHGEYPRLKTVFGNLYLHFGKTSVALRPELEDAVATSPHFSTHNYNIAYAEYQNGKTLPMVLRMSVPVRLAGSISMVYEGLEG